MKPAVIALALVLAATSACTTLGPMPAAMAISAVPTNRPGIEVTAGIVPGYMLSDATYEAKGTPLGQVAGLVEPDKLLGIPGVIVGARQVGSDSNTIIEPFVGYRRQLDSTIALAGVAYGTHASGESGTANYEATHAGAEVTVDAKLVDGAWAQLHWQASASLTHLSATGRYCTKFDGTGTDCNEDEHDMVVDADISGMYATASTGVSLDLFRRPEGVVHTVRLAALMTAGAMPRIRNGVQEKGDGFVSGGLTMTVGLGQ